MNKHTPEFDRFLTLYNRYITMTKKEAGHIMSPMDPVRMLYKQTLYEMLEMMRKHPDFMDKASDHFYKVKNPENPDKN